MTASPPGNNCRAQPRRTADRATEDIGLRIYTDQPRNENVECETSNLLGTLKDFLQDLMLLHLSFAQDGIYWQQETIVKSCLYVSCNGFNSLTHVSNSNELLMKVNRFRFNFSLVNLTVSSLYVHFITTSNENLDGENKKPLGRKIIFK